MEKQRAESTDQVQVCEPEIREVTADYGDDTSGQIIQDDDDVSTTSTCFRYIETTVQIEIPKRSKEFQQDQDEQEDEDDQDRKKEKEKSTNGKDGIGTKEQEQQILSRVQVKENENSYKDKDDKKKEKENGDRVISKTLQRRRVQRKIVGKGQTQTQIKTKTQPQTQPHSQSQHDLQMTLPTVRSADMTNGQKRTTSFQHLHLDVERNAFSLDAKLDLVGSQEVTEKLRSLASGFLKRTSKTKAKIQRPPTPPSELSSECLDDEEHSGLKQLNRLLELCPTSAEGSCTQLDDQEKGSSWTLKAFRCWKMFSHYLTFNFVLDTQSKSYVGWLVLVSLCFLYNAWVIPLRVIFHYQTETNVQYWLFVDLLTDFFYIVDIFIIKSHIKFIQNGFWVKDPHEIRKIYFHSCKFRVGLMSLFPLDILCAVFYTNLPYLRLPRLLKIETFWEAFQRLDTILSSPHPARILRTILYMLYLIHMYSCAYFGLSSWETNAGYKTDWKFDGKGNAYIRCFHFATKTATSIGKNPKPENEIEYLFMTCAWLSGVFVFAVLIGQIRDIIATATKNQTDYRQVLYTAVNYLHRLDVPKELQDRVKLWLTYTWQHQKTLDDSKILDLLPHKMQSDIALHVHIDMLNKVKLFQNCESHFLRDLVLKLRSVIFLPRDYVCRKGEVGREMYIVKSGRVDVIGEVEGQEKLLASLHAGSVFGEIALLQIGGMDKRTADVRSAGFSNLFVLSKRDIAEVIKDYPLAQESLKKQAQKLIREKTKSANKAVSRWKKKVGKESSSDSDSNKVNQVIIKPRRKPQPKLIDTILQIVPRYSKTAQYLQQGSKVASPKSMSRSRQSSISSYPPSPYLPPSASFDIADVSISNSSSEQALMIFSNVPLTEEDNTTLRDVNSIEMSSLKLDQIVDSAVDTLHNECIQTMDEKQQTKTTNISTSWIPDPSTNLESDVEISSSPHTFPLTSCSKSQSSFPGRVRLFRQFSVQSNSSTSSQ